MRHLTGIGQICVTEEEANWGFCATNYQGKRTSSGHAYPEMRSHSQEKSSISSAGAVTAIALSVFYYPLHFMFGAYEYMYYIIISIILAFLMFSHRTSKSIQLAGVILFGIYMSAVSVVGIFYSQNILHVSQIVIYFIIPVGFFLSGYTIKRDIFIRSLVVILIILFSFTVIERAEFWLGLEFLGFVQFSAKIKSAALSYGVDPSFGRATGLFINPNQLGFFAGTILFAILSIKSTNEIRGLAVICMMAIVLILLSGSRGSMFAFAIAALVYILVSRSFRILPALAGTAVLVFVGYLYVGANAAGSFEAFMDRLLYGSTYQSDSMAGRLTFWSSVFQNVNLLTGTLIPPEMYLQHAIDSFYMRTLAQGGVLGMLSGLVLFLSQFLGANRLAPAKARGAFLALLTFVAVNSFSMLGLLDLQAVFVWIIMGLVAKRVELGSVRRPAVHPYAS